MKKVIVLTLIVGFVLPPLLGAHLMLLIFLPSNPSDSFLVRLITPIENPVVYAAAFIQIAPSALACALVAAYTGYRTSLVKNPKWLLRFGTLGVVFGAIAPLGMLMWNSTREPHLLHQVLAQFVPIGMATGLVTSLIIMNIWKRYCARLPNQAL